MALSGRFGSNYSSGSSSSSSNNNSAPAGTSSVKYKTTSSGNKVSTNSIIPGAMIRGQESSYAGVGDPTYHEWPENAANASVAANPREGATTPASASQSYTSKILQDSERLFNSIKSGELTPSKTDPTWSSMYVNGEPTMAQKRAYLQWDIYNKKNAETQNQQATPQETVNGQQGQDYDITSINSIINNLQSSLYGQESSAGVETRGGSSSDILDSLFGVGGETAQGDQATQDSSSFSLAQRQEELYAQLGINSLESDVNYYTAQEEQLYATLRQREADIINQPTSMGVIAGRVTVEERNMMERIDAVSRLKARAVDQLNSKYTLMNMTLEAEKWDATQAENKFNQQFTQKIQLINLLRDIKSDMQDEKEAMDTKAEALFSTAFDQFNKIGWENLSQDQQTFISGLAVKAGVPSETAKMLLSGQSEKGDLISSSKWTRNDGKEVISLVFQDKNGEISTTTIPLGVSSDYINVGSGSGDYETYDNYLSLGDISSNMNSNAGSGDWEYGLDFVISGDKGASVPSPFTGTVIGVVSDYSNPNAAPLDRTVGKSQNGGFGNQVKIRLANGDEVWISHLDSANVAIGETVEAGQIIGTQGNTGLTGSNHGGSGAHLDITMTNGEWNGKYSNGGNFRTFKEVKGILETSSSSQSENLIKKSDAEATQKEEEKNRQNAEKLALDALYKMNEDFLTAEEAARWLEKELGKSLSEESFNALVKNLEQDYEAKYNQQ